MPLKVPLEVSSPHGDIFKFTAFVLPTVQNPVDISV